MQRPKKQVKPPRRKLMGGERAHEEASRRVTKTSRWVPQPGSRCLCFTHTHRLTLRSHTVSFSIWSGRWGRARQGRNKCTLTLFAQKSPCMPKTQKPREVKDPCQAAWCPWLCRCSLSLLKGRARRCPVTGRVMGCGLCSWSRWCPACGLSSRLTNVNWPGRKKPRKVTGVKWPDDLLLSWTR